jgi:ketosteroid isomerase-like protein
MYTTARIIQALDISRETLRQWTVTFRSFLSPGANPGGRRERRYTAEDICVLAYIYMERKAASDYETISAQLMQGQRGELSPESKAILSGETSAEIILATEQLRLSLQQQTAAVAELQTQLTAAMRTCERQTGQIELLQQMLAAKEDELRQLYGKLGDKH